MTHEMTVNEFGDSVTGFDEIAITQRFGRTLTDMTADYSMFGRALVFVAKRREGLTDDAAWNAAMELPFKGVSTFFAESSAEGDEEESGKGDEEHDPAPETVSDLPPASLLTSV